MGIAIRASSSGGRERPIEIRSEALRAARPPEGAAGWLGFAMPGDAAPLANESSTGRWRQADVRRAINAAEKAGLRHYRVEIAPDGTIAIVVGMAGTAEHGSAKDPA